MLTFLSRSVTIGVKFWRSSYEKSSKNLFSSKILQQGISMSHNHRPMISEVSCAYLA